MHARLHYKHARDASLATMDCQSTEDALRHRREQERERRERLGFLNTDCTGFSMPTE